MLHPGICPEYRNAHGCFWALARRDLERVGMTLLRVDPGIDTGPVFLHGTYDFDEVEESHAVIQYRAVTRKPRCDRATCWPRSAAAKTFEPIRVDGRESRRLGSAATHRVPALEIGRRAGNAMRVVSLLFHDVYASDPRESGFCSPAADRYKLSVRDFVAQLDGLAKRDA